MRKSFVIAFTGRGANDAIRGLMAEYGAALSVCGFSVVEVDPGEPAELQFAIDRMARGEVAFGLTWLGIGQDLKVTEANSSGPRNAWELFGVPLLKLHGDLPAYFSDFHRDVPDTTVNLYHADEFAHFWRNWLPRERALTVQIPPLPLSATARATVDRSARKQGKLVFLKNGNSPVQLRQIWRDRLSPVAARVVEEMAEAITPEALRPGCIYIGDFVADFLARRLQAEPRSLGSLLLFFAAQMDDYLRRVKSEMIVRAILDLPVIVQGDLWEHVDFSGRRAQHVGGKSYQSSLEIYRNQLGIIDMSPNVDSWPHDRIQRAAGSFTLLLTNRQGWISEQFPGFDDLTFEFNEESIKVRVADAIENPDRYLDLAMAFGERFCARYTQRAFAQRLIEAAELATLNAAGDKPHIQPFFVWPRGPNAP